MFHVLDSKDALYLKAFPENEATKVMCGVSTLRCAVSQKDFQKFANAGKLRIKNLCKSCYARAGRLLSD